jgi:dTDP-4-amino-4,6-dideoxygalactose transaminase
MTWSDGFHKKVHSDMENNALGKCSINDLAMFGGTPLFQEVKPTSNLVCPDRERFFAHLAQADTSTGRLAGELESKLAALHGTSDCVSFNSGFWALALLIDATRLADRSEVILPSLTYRRMADIVSWVNLVPHFCDIETDTLAVSAQTVAPCINARTAGIIAVHPVGGFCDIEGLEALAARGGIPLIFDSVESVHESLRGRRVGSFGNAELFSIGASKLINVFVGGYVTTNDSGLAHALREKRIGQGSRLSLSACLPEAHAALALACLEDLPDQLKRNTDRFHGYRQGLAKLPGFRLVEQDPATEPSYKNIVMEVLDDWPFDRDLTVQMLNAENILARVYYAPPLTWKPMSYPHIDGPLPNTDWVARHFISMPCGHLVSGRDIERTIDLLGFIRTHADSIRSRLDATQGHAAAQ